MAHDQLALDHLNRLVTICRKRSVDNPLVDLAEEFLARRASGLPENVEEPKASLCDNCFHAAMCVVYNMMPEMLQVKVGACQGHMSVPAEPSAAEG